MKYNVHRGVMAVAVACPLGWALACGGGATWESVAAENAAGMQYVRDTLAVVKSKIDENPDASGYPACTPSDAYKYRPLGPWSDHTIDFIDYSRLATGGLPDREHHGYEVLPETSLSKALFWTHPDNTYSKTTAFGSSLQVGYPAEAPTTDDIARVYAVQALKYVVVAKERDGSTAGHVRSDAFLVALNPVEVKCVIAVRSDGEQAGTAAVRMIEETINTKTNKVIRSREVVVGGYHTTDASHQARTNFEHLAFASLGVTPAPCSSDAACSSFKGTFCVAGGCSFDLAKEAALAAEREPVLAVFEATRAKYEECGVLKSKDLADRNVGRDAPGQVCGREYWEDVKAEAARRGVDQDQVDEYYKTWMRQQ